MVDRTYSSSISLIAPFDGQIILRDRITGSSSETRTSIVSVETYDIQGEPGVECFFSETQVTTPSLGDSRFTTVLFPTASLSASVGPKTVYFWCKKESNLQRSYNSIFLAEVYPCDTETDIVVPKVAYDFEEGTVSDALSGSNQPLSRIDSAISDIGEVLTVWQDISTGSIIGRVDNSDFSKVLGPKVLLTGTGPANPASFVSAITGIDVAADFDTGGWVLAYTRNVGSVSADIYYVRIGQDLSVGPEKLVANGAYPRIDCAENGTVSVAYRDGTYQMSGDVKLVSYNSSNATVFITTVFNPSGTLVNSSLTTGEHELVVDKASGTITVAHSARPLTLRVTRYTSAGALESPGTIDIQPGSWLVPTANTLTLANRYGSKEFVVAWHNSSTIFFVAYDASGTARYPIVSTPAAASSHKIRPALLSLPTTSSADAKLVIKHNSIVSSVESNNVFVYDSDNPPHLIRDLIVDTVGQNGGTLLYQGLTPLVPIDSHRFSFSVPITGSGNKISRLINKQYDININSLVDNTFYLSFRTQRFLTLSSDIFANFDCPIANESYLLSETQTTIPSTSHPGFTSAIGTVVVANFTLATNSGIHTVYLWTKTTSVNSLVSFATIFLMADNQIVLRDRLTNSSSRTSSNVVSVETYTSNSVVDFECFFSTSQAITPSIGDSRFTTSLSTTMDIGLPVGVITAYLWCKKDTVLQRTHNSIFYREAPDCETAEIRRPIKEVNHFDEFTIQETLAQNASAASTDGNVLYIWQDAINGDILGRVDNEGFAKEKGPKLLIPNAGVPAITGSPPTDFFPSIDIASDLANAGWVIAFTRGITSYYARVDADLNVGSSVTIAAGGCPRIDADENGNVAAIYRGPAIVMSYPVTLLAFDASDSPVFSPTTVPDPTGTDFAVSSTVAMHDIFVEKISGDITTVHASKKPVIRVTRYNSTGSIKTTVPATDIGYFFGLPINHVNCFNLAHRYGSNDIAVMWGGVTGSAFVRIAAVDSAGAIKYSVLSPALGSGAANRKARIFYTSPPDTFAVDPKLVLQSDTTGITGGESSFYIYENDSIPTLRETIIASGTTPNTGGGIGFYFGPPAASSIDDEKIRFVYPAGRIIGKELDLEINTLEQNRFYLIDGINQAFTRNADIRAVFECPIVNQEYLLSETQTTTPTTSHPGFTSAIGTVSFANFTLTAAFGVHTVYLWTKTGTIAVDDVTTSSNIFLGIDGQIILRDRITGSSSMSQSNVLTVEAYEVNGIPDIECFFSETQVITPSISDSRFTNSLLPTVAVSDFSGRKTVYLWCKAGSYLTRSHNNIFLSPTGNCETIDAFQINKFRDFAEEGTAANSIHSLASATSTDGNVLTVWADAASIYGRIDNEDFAKVKGPKALISNASFPFSGGGLGPLGTIDLAPDLSTGGWVIAYCRDSSPIMSIYYARIDSDLNVVSETTAFPPGVLISGEIPRIDTDQAGNVVLACRQSAGPNNVQLTSYSVTNSLRFLITTVPNSAGSSPRVQDIVVDKQSGEICLLNSRATTFSLRLTRYTSTGTLVSTVDVSEFSTPVADSLWLANRFGSKEFVATWKASSFLRFVAFDEFGVQKYPVQSIASSSVKNNVIVTGPANTYAIDPRIVIREARSAADLNALNSFYVYENDSVPTLAAIINEPSDPNDGIASLTHAPPALSAIDDDRFRYGSTHQVLPSATKKYVSFKEIDLSVESVLDRQFYLSYGRSRIYSNSINVRSNFDCPIANQDYLLSETQTTVPTTTHPGFISVGSTLSFTNFVLSTFVGLHTVYLWTRTGTQSIDSVVSFSTIFLTPLGFQPPYETEIVLQDRITGSYEETVSEIVSVNVYETANNLASLVFFVSETQSTAPTTTDIRFATTIPATFNLTTGLGIRTLYLWHKEPSQAIVGSQNSIFLNPSASCATDEDYFVTKELDNFEEDTVIGSAKGLCMSTSTSHRVLSVWIDEEFNDIVGRVDNADFTKAIGPKVLVSNVSTFQSAGNNKLNATSSWPGLCEDLSTGGWVLTYTITDNVYYRKFGPNLEDLSGADKFVNTGTNSKVGVDENGNIVVCYRFHTGGLGTDFVRFTKFDSSGTVIVPQTIVTASTTTRSAGNESRAPAVLVHKQSGKFLIAQEYTSVIGGTRYISIEIARFTAAGLLETANATIQFFGTSSSGLAMASLNSLVLAARYGSDEFIIGWNNFLPLLGPNCFFRKYDAAGNAQTPITTVGSSTTIRRRSNLCIDSAVNTISPDSRIFFRMTGDVPSTQADTFIYENSVPITHLATVTEIYAPTSGGLVPELLPFTALGENRVRHLVQFAANKEIVVKEINLLGISPASAIFFDGYETTTRHVDVNFDCPVWGSSYLLSETQTTIPTSTNPSFITIGGSLTTAPLFLADTLGLHTVYAWYRNGGIVSPSFFLATISFFPAEIDISYSSSVDIFGSADIEYSASGFLVNLVGPMTEEISYTSSANLKKTEESSYAGSVNTKKTEESNYSSTANLASTIDSSYTASSSLESPAGTFDTFTWNYVLQPGNNMVSAALSCTPGLFAKSFVSNSPADFFFYENNGVLSTQLGSAIHLNPNNPTVNRPINPGFGYIVSLNSSFAGLVRTVSITGFAWEN